MEKNETLSDAATKVFELGYLLVPTIPEENVAAEVESLKSSIEKLGGAFITEDFPKLRPLAFTMIKAIGSKRTRHDRAYFGWVKFEASSDKMPILKSQLDKNENILRFLIITTVRENTMVTQKVIFKPTVEKKPGEEQPKMTQEEIDKTIDNLVVE
jgi:ribosomal protein S6